ncbi:hypothetical protein [Mycobacterium sp. 852002-51961_SCH5331710]|uniref:hypothetical protein n=1 Tax=Mycobacterium sp. 852002-51961_SCH5331710 TaxID=1834105 RepID=UPI0008019B29|nr:hypothetical protein [Mycobacterium sp. 852002-51961_SCH5331710]OBB45429.1 hypothetical protein A5752_02075 [Mycobacterium sp. 852002-51961_SCH5331710]
MTDVGLDMIESIYQQLMIDDRWAVRTERGFTWWGYRLAQHVEVGHAVRSGDLDVYQLRIWTEVARNVSAEADVAALVTPANFHQSMNALVWDPASATIRECCTAVVHRENIGWLGKIVATAAILQNVAAHTRAHAIAEVCRGEPAASDHPSSGHRAEMDDILNVPQALIIPAGAEPSKYEGRLSEGLGDFAARMGWVGNSDATGVVFEVPFTGNRPLFMQDRNAPDVALETALVQIFTDQPHPEAGNGALTVMQLPISPGSEHAAALANELNLIESQGDLRAPLLGAWCPDIFSKDGNGLAFCSFLPNLIARPGLLENQMVYQGARARFALEQLGRLGVL